MAATEIEFKVNPEGIEDLLSEITGLQIFAEVRRELCRAIGEHPPFNSAHDHYAVIKEELDELWDEIKKKKTLRSPERMKQEAIQVAAMAIRFIQDVIDKDGDI